MSKAVNQAYNVIRDAILAGEIAPGERLREGQLTTLAGVSRTPVREALRQLVQDGFAIVERNRGASVPIHTTKDIDEIYGLRTLIEGHAARRAAVRITPEAIDELERISEKLENLLDANCKEDDSPDTHFEKVSLYNRFHEIILEAADNRRMKEYLDQLSQIALTARTFTRYGEAGEKRNIDGHREIIRALKSGYPDWAEAAMRIHVHNARRVMTLFVKSEEAQMQEIA